MERRIAISVVGLLAVVSLLIAGCPPPAVEPEPPILHPKPVTVHLLIRSDLPPYPAVGHYIADQLETLGFTVIRTVRTGPETHPIWMGPINTGLWHAVTGGWVSPTIPRDQAAIFDQMHSYRVMTQDAYTWLREPLSQPQWATLNRSIFDLAYSRFSTMAERATLFNTTMWGAIDFSNKLWLTDIASLFPFRTSVNVGTDAAGGVGDPSWVHTAHFQVGGVPQVPTGDTNLRVALPVMLPGPWNPVEGSAWAWDMWLNRRALGDAAVVWDPRAGPTGGLPWAHRLQNASVTVLTGLPVNPPVLNWTTLSFAPTITPPDDAWTDWNATAQTWITVGERRAADPTWNRSAKRMSIVQYPDDIFTLPLHDGSTLSLADFLMGMIVEFDRGKVGSPVFDATVAPRVEAMLATLKGVKILDTDPLTIATWSDIWEMDAEMNVSPWFPVYGVFDWTGFWHKVAVGWAADSAGPGTGATNTTTAAFSAGKATAANVTQMDYTKGPTLPILATELAWARDNNFIPYEDFIRPFYADAGLNLTAEITQRWDNLHAFHATRGHIWVGNGPFMIANVTDIDPAAPSVILRRFAAYPDWAGRFLHLSKHPVTGIAPNHTGSWFDRVTFTRELSHALAVTRLADPGVGGIDIFGGGVVDPLLVGTIRTTLRFGEAFGGYRDLRFNTFARFLNATHIIPEFIDADPGPNTLYHLNPFAVPEIRRALNWAVHRPHMVATWQFGLGAPKWTALGTAFPDHARYWNATVLPIQTMFAFNMTRANSTIHAAMMAIPGVNYTSIPGPPVRWIYTYLSPHTNSTL